MTKQYGQLDALDFSKGGIPETGKVNKNKSALLMIDRDEYDLDKLTEQISDLLTDLLEGTIDSITIDVKTRRW